MTNTNQFGPAVLGRLQGVGVNTYLANRAVEVDESGEVQARIIDEMFSIDSTEEAQALNRDLWKVVNFGQKKLDQNSLNPAVLRSLGFDLNLINRAFDSGVLDQSKLQQVVAQVCRTGLSLDKAHRVILRGDSPVATVGELEYMGFDVSVVGRCVVSSTGWQQFDEVIDRVEAGAFSAEVAMEGLVAQARNRLSGPRAVNLRARLDRALEAQQLAA